MRVATVIYVPITFQAFKLVRRFTKSKLKYIPDERLPHERAFDHCRQLLLSSNYPKVVESGLGMSLPYILLMDET